MRNSVSCIVKRSTTRRCRSALRLLLGAVPISFLGMLLFSAGFAAAPTAVLDAMKAELGRSVDTLKKQAVPLYFLSYEITDTHNINVHSAFGKLVNSSENRRRQLDIDVRVGDYNIDNTHDIRGSFPGFDVSDRFSFIEVPVEDNPDAIRQLLSFGGMMMFDFAFGDIPGPLVSFVVPSLLFEDVSIRKPSGEFSKPPLSQSPTQ
jgi:hypothetical protein